MKISTSETIQAPRERVFEVFSDIPRAQERIDGIAKLEVLSEVDRGPGLRWRETRVMFGKEATEEMEITGFEEPRSYVVEAESHGTHYTSCYTFNEADDDRTDVTVVFMGRPVTLLSKLMTPMWLLFKGATERALKQDMTDLKRYLESSPS